MGFGHVWIKWFQTKSKTLHILASFGIWVSRCSKIISIQKYFQELSPYLCFKICDLHICSAHFHIHMYIWAADWTSEQVHSYSRQICGLLLLGRAKQINSNGPLCYRQPTQKHSTYYTENDLLSLTLPISSGCVYRMRRFRRFLKVCNKMFFVFSPCKLGQIELPMTFLNSALQEDSKTRPTCLIW